MLEVLALRALPSNMAANKAAPPGDAAPGDGRIRAIRAGRSGYGYVPSGYGRSAPRARAGPHPGRGGGGRAGIGAAALCLPKRRGPGRFRCFCRIMAFSSQGRAVRHAADALGSQSPPAPANPSVIPPLGPAESRPDGAAFLAAEEPIQQGAFLKGARPRARLAGGSHSGDRRRLASFFKGFLPRWIPVPRDLL